MTTPAAPTVWDTTKVSTGFAYAYLGAGGSAFEPMSTLLGTNWASPWSYAGATNEGWSINWNKSTQTINIEEQELPAQTLVSTVDLSFQAELAQDEAQNLLYALGVGTLTTEAATAELGAVTTINLNSVMNDYAIGLDAPNGYGFFTRYYIPHSYSTGDVTVALRRAEAAKSYSVEMHANCRPDQIIIKYLTTAPGVTTP